MSQLKSVIDYPVAQELYAKKMANLLGTDEFQRKEYLGEVGFQHDELKKARMEDKLEDLKETLGLSFGKSKRELTASLKKLKSSLKNFNFDKAEDYMHEIQILIEDYPQLQKNLPANWEDMLNDYRFQKNANTYDEDEPYLYHGKVGYPKAGHDEDEDYDDHDSSRSRTIGDFKYDDHDSSRSRTMGDFISDDYNSSRSRTIGDYKYDDYNSDNDESDDYESDNDESDDYESDNDESDSKYPEPKADLLLDTARNQLAREARKRLERREDEEASARLKIDLVKRNAELKRLEDEMRMNKSTRSGKSSRGHHELDELRNWGDEYDDYNSDDERLEREETETDKYERRVADEYEAEVEADEYKIREAEAEVDEYERREAKAEADEYKRREAKELVRRNNRNSWAEGIAERRKAANKWGEAYAEREREEDEDFMNLLKKIGVKEHVSSPKRYASYAERKREETDDFPNLFKKIGVKEHAPSRKRALPVHTVESTKDRNDRLYAEREAAKDAKRYAYSAEKKRERDEDLENIKNIGRVKEQVKKIKPVGSGKKKGGAGFDEDFKQKLLVKDKLFGFGKKKGKLSNQFESLLNRAKNDVEPAKKRNVRFA